MAVAIVEIGPFENREVCEDIQEELIREPEY
jgi:hypothetical protein